MDRERGEGESMRDLAKRRRHGRGWVILFLEIGVV